MLILERGKNEKIIIILDNCQEIDSSEELRKFTQQLLNSTLFMKIILISTSNIPFMPFENTIKIEPLRPRHLATIIRNDRIITRKIAEYIRLKNERVSLICIELLNAFIIALTPLVEK